MKYLRLAILVLPFVLSSCSGGKSIQKSIDEAAYAYQSGSYEQSLQLSRQAIDKQLAKGKNPDGSLYLYAGLSAWELKQTQKAIDYLEKAKGTPAISSLGYLTLAGAYLRIDNLSKEISNLEEYTQKFPNGAEIPSVQKQLFWAYVKGANWDAANSLWPKIDRETQGGIEYLAGYLEVCRNLGLDEQRDITAQQILKIDKNHVGALEVLADKYFWLAENRYQAEMKAYNSNRTNKQYSILLKVLETINENFKVSRDYYLRLWDIDKKPKYATYLGNIYSRFDNKEKADYYYRQAKKN